MAGNLTTELTATTSRTHTYDAANRLTRILPSTGDDADLVYDPLGRIATRQVGANPVQTYRYVGASDLVWQQASGGTTTSSIVDPSGARVGATDGTASGGAWLLFDLLGSVAGAESGASGAGTAVTNALRYDAYGQTIGTYPSTGSSLPVRYRGLIDLAPTADTDVAGTGSDPLYAMGARLYAPHLGGFTSLDTYAGEAQDPASLNRYLYAYANPATLIDPTGHRICEYDCQGNATPAELKHSNDTAVETGSASGGTVGASSPTTGTNPGTTSTGGMTPSTTTPVLTAGGADPPSVNVIPYNALPSWQQSCYRGHCSWSYSVPADWSELALTGCSLVPVLGTACDAEDLRRNVARGDAVGTGLAFVGFLWGAGDLIKLAGKGVNGTINAVIRSVSGAEDAARTAARGLMRGVDTPHHITRGGLKQPEFEQAGRWGPIRGGRIIGLPKLRGSIGDAADLTHNGVAVSLKRLGGEDQTVINEV